jgi:hypothetical protein
MGSGRFVYSMMVSSMAAAVTAAPIAGTPVALVSAERFTASNRAMPYPPSTASASCTIVAARAVTRRPWKKAIASRSGP